MSKQVYTRLTAWWEGRRDGKRGFPALDDERPSFYVQDLQNTVEGLLDELARSWKERDTKLKSEWCTLRDRLERARESLDRARTRNAASEADLTEARQLYEESYGRDRISPAGYWTLMAVFGLAEFPLNTFVFDLIGEARLWTLVMASSLAIGVPVFAHLLGRTLKRRPFQSGWLHTEAVFAYVLMLLPAILFGLIGYLRQKLVEASGTPTLMGIELDPAVTFGMFFVLNIFVYTAATVLAFNHAQPGERGHRHRLKKALARRAAESEEVGKLEAVIEATMERLHEVREEREQVLVSHRAEAAASIDNFERHVAKYRKHNVRRRKDPQRPAAFLSSPAVDMPAVLHPDGPELSWNCGDQSSGVGGIAHGDMRQVAS